MLNRNIPIFMYHDIVPLDSIKDLPFERRHYAISVDQFKFHLELIKKNGFQAKTVDEISNINPEQKAVVLTFDDGHISQYQHAFKILQEFGLTGSFFIVPSWINQPDFINWEMIQEMSDFKMSIQSHTNSHQFLIQLMSKQIVDEIKISKKIIEDKTGKSVNYLSLPGGRFERKIWQLAGFYGYKGIFTSKPGYGDFTPFWMKIVRNWKKRTEWFKFKEKKRYMIYWEVYCVLMKMLIMLLIKKNLMKC